MRTRLLTDWSKFIISLQSDLLNRYAGTMKRALDKNQHAIRSPKSATSSPPLSAANGARSVTSTNGGKHCALRR
jgi:hypothetical protein